jgi:carbon monoxide dehydrogenase subunit G
VESLKETSPDHFDAVMRVGVAAINGTYKGKVDIVDKQEPISYTLDIEGSGGPGFVNGTASISLIAEGDRQVGGMLAGVVA